jgi:hypothetical protein
MMMTNAPTAGNEAQLRAFLGAATGSRRFRLLLPEFGGPSRLNSVPSDLTFQYRGTTFAERDTRAASCVQNLLDQVVEIGNVTMEPAGTQFENQDIAFLFGSRSNRAAQFFLEQLPNPLFELQFAAEWTIICNQQRFSLPDPTVTAAVQYETSDDYGVIARVQSASPGPVFIIAGLGGRATEGCGVYFRDHWEELNSQFPNGDFAVVLKFSAPFDVHRAEQVAQSSTS